MKFMPFTDPLQWESLVLPGIERGAPPFQQLVAQASPGMADLIQAYWIFYWSFEDGNAFEALAVPNPCHNLVGMRESKHQDAPTELLISPPRKKSFILPLRGSGFCFGVQFRAGGLSALLPRDSSELKVRSEVQIVFPDHPPLPSPHESVSDLTKWFVDFDSYLFSRRRDEPRLQAVSNVIDCLLADGKPETVRDLSEALGISERTQQRVLGQLLGLSPKELIRICRFQGTLKTLNLKNLPTLLQVAHDSGFFDEAHMINDFKKLIGHSPKRLKKYW